MDAHRPTLSSAPGTNLSGTTNYGPGSHAATVEGCHRWGFTFSCDCGRRYPAEHTAASQWESTQWEAHVRERRAAAMRERILRGAR